MKKFSEFIRGYTTHTNLIVLILLVTISPYIFLAFFSVPSADDFSHASSSLNRGVFGFVIHRYLNWSGRYSSDIVISTYHFFGDKIHKNFLIDFYYIVPTFLIVIYSVSSYLFISSLAGKNIAWRIIFTLSSTIFMLSSVELRSTIFWLAGGMTYTLANSLFLISLAITISTVYIDSLDKRSSLLTSLNIGLIFFVNGFNEALMASNTIVISGLLFFSCIFRNLRKNEYNRLVYFEMSAIMSSLIVFFSPGNAIRASQDSQKIGIVRALVESLLSMLDNIYVWAKKPSWPFFCVLLLFVIYHIFSDKLELYIKDKRKFIPTIASLMLALYMSYFARYYSLGNGGPLRANSTSHVLFFALIVLLCFYGFIKFNFHHILNPTGRQKKPLLVFVVFVIFCFLATLTNLKSLKNDFLNLKEHYAYYQAVYPKLATGSLDSVFEVQPEPRVSILRWKCYLTDDKKYWTNKAVAKYFNVESVTAIGGGAPDPECGGFQTYKKPN